MDDRGEDDLHRESHLAAWYNQVVGAGHEGAVNHTQQFREVGIEFLRILEADDYEALIGSGDVACDKGVGGIDCSNALEVDVGA